MLGEIIFCCGLMHILFLCLLWNFLDWVKHDPAIENKTKNRAENFIGWYSLLTIITWAVTPGLLLFIIFFLLLYLVYGIFGLVVEIICKTKDWLYDKQNKTS